jgi:hypothetical protein
MTSAFIVYHIKKQSAPGLTRTGDLRIRNQVSNFRKSAKDLSEFKRLNNSTFLFLLSRMLANVLVFEKKFCMMGTELGTV